MATRKRGSSASKPLARTPASARRKSARRSFFQSLPVRTIVVVAGVAGLAALGVALFSSRRFNEEIVRPVGKAIAPQADRVWAETPPWRDHVSRILTSINTAEVREQVAQQMSRWIDRFR